MSRTTLWRLHPLGDDDLRTLIGRAEELRRVRVSEEAVQALVASADGDARSLLTTLDTASILAQGDADARDGAEVTREHVSRARDGRLVHQSRDTHYDQVSALIKSVRGSDPDAALYWLVALLEAGESARFLARRLVILASEDIGIADSQALVVAESAARAVEFVGLPEARLNLAHCAIYLSLAPKSNSVTRALGAVTAAVRAGGGQVPTHLRDAHYAGAREVGFGDGYVYPHDLEGGWADQRYLPEEVGDETFFAPTSYGDEERLVRQWRQRRGDTGAPGPAPVE
jgi:putative ATPase